MIDIFAALGLAAAAARTENPTQLFADAETLYGVYQRAKGDKLDVHALAASGELKKIIAAAARTTAAANALMQDPTQEKNLTELLASI